MKKVIHFLMVITPYQLRITDYCVNSYKKVYDALKDSYRFKLILYLNGFKKGESNNFLRKWSKYSYVELVYGLDASEFVAKENGGYGYNSRNNSFPLERHGEVIDKFFVDSKCDFFVTVDDDFEIFNPDFFIEMLMALETSKDISIISTEFNETHKYYDNHSKDWIILKRRNTAWFCIYRISDILPISHEVVDRYMYPDGTYNFYDFKCGNWDDYFTSCRQVNSTREVFDTSGFCQEQIRENNSKLKKIFSLADLDGDFTGMYYHYGGCTSKIKKCFYLYRVLIIGTIRGNKYLRKLFKKILKLLYT